MHRQPKRYMFVTKKSNGACIQPRTRPPQPRMKTLLSCLCVSTSSAINKPAMNTHRRRTRANGEQHE
jgi:hypothetical protein